MNTLVLGGFLGSGKTSVLLSLARKFIEGKNLGETPKVIIIENEIGEVGVDDKILRTAGYSVENMFAGCACCSIAGDMVQSLREIERDIKPELVIVESSGVGYPHNIKENIVEKLGYPVKICTIADAKRWKRMLVPMNVMLHDQMQQSDYILVNKIDLVDKEMVDFVDSSVLEFAPGAKVYNIEATKGIDNALLDEILSF